MFCEGPYTFGVDSLKKAAPIEGSNTCAKAPTKRCSSPIANKALQSPQQKKQKANDIRAALSSLMPDIVVPGESVNFLDQNGNWPLCKTGRCKKLGKYVFYADSANEPPRFCFVCKSMEFKFVYYNNLKAWLASKNLIQKYNVDTKIQKHLEFFKYR